eukprot:m.54994 g.54994  ORF g.54994 m.54994 type:complete len:279 (+) comp9230_c0_seq3:135-971(+)
MASPHHKQPTAFLNHGGGPLPILDDPGHASLSKSIRQFAQSLSVAPVAVVLVTAHWLEKNGPGVTSAANPKLLFDYYGFPSQAYTLTYNAPGDPALAARVAGLLRGAGFDRTHQTDRAWDHGTFVPMMIGFPDAEIPIVQLSLLASQDPSQHLAMGRALAPLRDEGVLILGSGMSYHNMRAFKGAGVADLNAAASAKFDSWLSQTCTEVSPRCFHDVLLCVIHRGDCTGNCSRTSRPAHKMGQCSGCTRVSPTQCCRAFVATIGRGRRSWRRRRNSNI